MKNIDIEDELVEYETALLAKAKGFSIPVTYAYDGSGEIYHRTHILHDFNIRGLLSAPTQTSLRRWLREVHNIDLWEKDCDKTNKYQIEYITKDKILIGGTMYASPTYEEALELGLLEALNLI